jgi:very-short-patch-repair endonuclease
MTEFFNKATEKEKRRQFRNNAPQAETMVWSKLKGKQLLGYKFRRQYSVGPYVIDFYCPALKLAVEIDGDSHFEEGAKDYDCPRQSFIESFGIRFLRFTNEEVYRNLNGVLAAIAQIIQQANHKTPL